MVKIITADTDHPFSFPEGRQTFISKPHPSDEHAPGPLCLGAEFSFEYVQICRWRSVLMPLSFQQVKSSFSRKLPSICSPGLRNDERGKLKDTEIQALREVCRGLLEDGQFLSLLRQLSFKADIFSGQFAFAL